jgi:hypothetical protein
LLPFFTRRIGLSSNGQPIPVLGGVRLTGREGPWGIGLLNMQTEDYKIEDVVLRPADNFTAVRMTRDLMPGTSLGGFYFGRESGGDVTFNRVAGLDLLTQPTRSLRIEAFAMNSSTDGAPNDWAGRAGFSYESNTNRAYLFHHHVGDRFRHDLGFVRRDDVGLTFAKYEKILRPRATYPGIHAGRQGRGYQDSGYQELETRVANLSYNMSFQDGASFSVNFDDTYELLEEPFDIRPDIIIPPGDYDFREVSVSYASNRSASLSGDIQYRDGSFWDGHRKYVTGGLRVRFNEHIAVSGSYERNSVDLTEGSFVTNLGTVNLDWSFTPRMFLNAFVQYNSDTDAWLSNIRFNLIHRPLSDVFIVWNETRQSGLTLRSVIVKYTHMFSF